ncbi:MAG: spore maturation protein [Mycoplasmatota bacterium]|nr:spore maturation protein [Mycoplasmatota bacterium]
MVNISKYILPLITIIVIIHALIKKVNIYDEFLEGVKEGLSMSLNIFPSMFAIILAVTVFVKSNFLNSIISLINPTTFPKEILPIAILRPISSSSSLMLLNEILKTYGPDSLIGKIASVITGSTDTTIYIIGMYYSSVKITKIKHSLLVGLLADLSCVIISILIVKYL